MKGEEINIISFIRFWRDHPEHHSEIQEFLRMIESSPERKGEDAEVA